MWGCKRCAGLGEDVVDEVHALRCGQEWTVLGMLVEVPDEGVEAGGGMIVRRKDRIPLLTVIWPGSAA